jgi:hypothetical protein
VDRVASAWLIRRFIDPDARFLCLKEPQDCPPEAVGFDFDGAEFTHLGARITFEVLMASFDLDEDRALRRIGALVHYLDVGGIPVPEATGFAAILAGAAGCGKRGKLEPPEGSTYPRSYPAPETLGPSETDDEAERSE